MLRLEKSFITWIRLTNSKVFPPLTRFSADRPKQRPVCQRLTPFRLFGSHFLQKLSAAAFKWTQHHGGLKSHLSA